MFKRRIWILCVIVVLIIMTKHFWESKPKADLAMMQITLKRNASSAIAERLFHFYRYEVPLDYVHSVSRIFMPFISRRYVWCLSVIRVRHASA